MVERNAGASPKPRRERTDESLRAERERSDAVAVEKQLDLDETADQIVQVARERADDVVQAARDEADLEQPPAAGATAERERDVADAALARERSVEDAVLAGERVQRRKFLEAFLALEREATNTNLTDERAHADTDVAARDDFLAIVSHDLRSLLAGLSLSAQLLIENAAQGVAGDKTRKYARTSQRLVLRMSRLVNDLLDMASIDAGKLALLIQPSDVASIVSDTMEAFEPLAMAKGVALSEQAEPPALVAPLDAERILQVLANLVSNAIKFTPSGGRVTIRIVREADTLRFSVSDTGIGIAEDAAQSIFEKFKQLANDRHSLGLGLYISKGIVEAHGGRMWTESELGAGSTFHFTIPAVQPSTPSTDG